MDHLREERALSNEKLLQFIAGVVPSMLLFLYVLLRAAAVTEKASRVAPLVNSWTFKKGSTASQAPWMDSARASVRKTALNMLKLDPMRPVYGAIHCSERGRLLPSRTALLRKKLKVRSRCRKAQARGPQALECDSGDPKAL